MESPTHTADADLQEQKLFLGVGIALAPVAATIMLFTLAAKKMPVLPKEAAIH